MTPEQIEEYLDRHPDDWDFRLCSADVMEEIGDELRAAFLRWSGREKKHPCEKKPHWWFDWSDGECGKSPSRMPMPLKFNDLADFWIERGEEYYDTDTRLGAEHALAVYLREKGII